MRRSYKSNLQYYKERILLSDAINPHEMKVLPLPGIGSENASVNPLSPYDIMYQGAPFSNVSRELPYSNLGSNDIGQNNHFNLFTRFTNTATNQVEYACQVCEYISNKCSNIKQHVRVHSQEKPFMCHLCPYKASQRTNLKKHMLKHRPEGTEEHRPLNNPQLPSYIYK